MRGVYEAQISIPSLSAAKTLILIQVPSTIIVEILAARITNASVDTNEQLEAALYHVDSLGSPAGTTITPAKKEPGDQASACTLLGDLSAEPTTYSSTAFHGLEGFSNLAGYRFDPLPEDRPVVAPTKALGLKLITNPATAFKALLSLEWIERG